MILTVKRIFLGDIIANCYILCDDETGESAVIDPGIYSPELERAVSAGKIKYILITHGHFDHIMGAAELKRHTGAEIAVHRLDAPALSDRVLSLYEDFAHMLGDIRPDPAYADIMLSDGDELTLGGLRVRVMHTPGHTPGGVCYIAGDTIFSGDTLFEGSIGRTDFPGGSADDMMLSLQRLSGLKGDYRVLSGHGGETSLDRERRSNPYMRLG
jgi:hydroxyacylglutathione hydrolase